MYYQNTNVTNKIQKVLFCSLLKLMINRLGIRNQSMRIRKLGRYFPNGLPIKSINRGKANDTAVTDFSFTGEFPVLFLF